jgi:predicted RNA-binding protein YlqC (UPF0109 family)
MKELIEYIVKALVDNPNEVNISETQGEGLTIVEIKAAQADIGKVIGREGRIANAIRTVAKAAAAKQQKRVTVEILTEDERRGRNG